MRISGLRRIEGLARSQNALDELSEQLLDRQGKMSATLMGVLAACSGAIQSPAPNTWRCR